MKKKINQILQYLQKKRGFDFKGNRPLMLQRRISKRLIPTNSGTFEKYYDYLLSNPKEMIELINVLTINVSSFFRDPFTFEYLEKILIGLIIEKAQNNTQLRIWSVGCATGEEPYSVALLISRILNNTHKDINLNYEIFATDIDKHALESARKGIYYFESIKNVKFENLEENFEHHDLKYELKREIKNKVVFSIYDLLDKKSTTPPISIYGNFDVVLCRNVLIYFNKNYQRQINEKLYNSLNKKGYLILGESETIEQDYVNNFERVSKYGKIFRKM